MEKLTTEKFIENARKVHGNKYDYSKVEYIDAKTKVCIICPKHGEFWQTPSNHLSGRGCKLCTKPIHDTSSFIEEARKIHGEKYDYSKVSYKKTNVKICIICHEKDGNGVEHGEFLQTPRHHLYGNGCPKCANNMQYTTESFICAAKKVHGDKYDYSKVNYINNHTKICIIDKEVGEFWQLPQNHLKGCGCYLNHGKRVWDTRGRITTDDFIKRAKEIHGDKYDYSLVEYKDMATKVKITCKNCGNIFLQTPNNHINQGNGCPQCSTSKLEERVKVELEKNNIDYIKEADKSILPWIGRQRLDFYLPKYNLAIECQGIQHYEPVKQYGGKERLNAQIKADERKYNLCMENGIKILYYTKYKIDGNNVAKNNKELITKITHGF